MISTRQLQDLESLKQRYLKRVLGVSKFALFRYVCVLSQGHLPDRGPENTNASAGHTGIWGTATRATEEKGLDRGKLLHYRCNGQQEMDARRIRSKTCNDTLCNRRFPPSYLLKKNLPQSQPGVHMCFVQWTVQYLSCYGV